MQNFKVCIHSKTDSCKIVQMRGNNNKIQTKVKEMFRMLKTKISKTRNPKKNTLNKLY